MDCVTQTACDSDERQSLNQHTQLYIENENNLYLKNLSFYLLDLFIILFGCEKVGVARDIDPLI